MLAYLIAVLPELVAEIECSVLQPSMQTIHRMGRLLAPLVRLMQWALRHDTDRASLLVEGDESWGGRMVEIEKHIQRSANATLEHIHTLQTHVSAVDGKMDDIQEKLDRLLQQDSAGERYSNSKRS
jgi:hypothetical protein